MEYAGFWLRFVAKLIDVIIVVMVALPFYILFVLTFGVASVVGAEGMALIASQIIQMILSLGTVAYFTFFTGKYGATIGKMALGLKVVFPNGEPVTYLRAFGRFFAEYLSYIPFLVGYIIAAFDDEKCTFHDMLARTRVIRTR